MILAEKRREFADFLERLAANDDADRHRRWGDLCVNHYSDETLERVRRETVRLSIRKPLDEGYSPDEAAVLRAWAEELRRTG